MQIIRYTRYVDCKYYIYMKYETLHVQLLPHDDVGWAKLIHLYSARVFTIYVYMI